MSDGSNKKKKKNTYKLGDINTKPMFSLISKF